MIQDDQIVQPEHSGRNQSNERRDLALMAFDGEELGSDIETLRVVAKDVLRTEAHLTLEPGEVAHNEERRINAELRGDRCVPVHSGLHQGRTICDIFSALLRHGAGLVVVGTKDDFSHWEQETDPVTKEQLLAKFIQGSINYYTSPEEYHGSDVYLKAMQTNLTSEDRLKDPSHIGYVDTAVIEPGECRGTYLQLHAMMIERMRAEGIEAAYGLCHIDNPIALRLHLRRGYSIVGEVEIPHVEIDPHSHEHFTNLIKHHLLRLDVNSEVQTAKIREAREEGLGHIGYFIKSEQGHVVEANLE